MSAPDKSLTTSPRAEVSCKHEEEIKGIAARVARKAWEQVADVIEGNHPDSDVEKNKISGRTHLAMKMVELHTRAATQAQEDRPTVNAVLVIQNTIADSGEWERFARQAEQSARKATAIEAHAEEVKTHEVPAE